MGDRFESPGPPIQGISLRLTWRPWLVGYYGTRGISRGARKLVRTPSLSKKKKKISCITNFIKYSKETDLNTFCHGKEK